MRGVVGALTDQSPLSSHPIKFGSTLCRGLNEADAPASKQIRSKLMRKLILLSAAILGLSFGTANSAHAGVHVGIGIGVPVYYGPGYAPGYWYGPGYYAPGYYWGPSGYIYYRRPYWRHRYWRRHRWYYY